MFSVEKTQSAIDPQSSVGNNANNGNLGYSVRTVVCAHRSSCRVLH